MKSLIFRGIVILFAVLLSACDNQPQSHLPLTTLSTEYGDITIELDIKNAPISAGNFLAYVQGGHFKTLAFYRTVSHQNDNHDLKIAVLQGGLDIAFNDIIEPEFPPIAHESTAQTGLLHKRGAVSFARSDLGTAQTEFFISTQDNTHLDAGGLRHPDKQGFAVFGRVVKGMDVVDTIAGLSSDLPHADPYVQGQVLDRPVMISDVRLVN